MGRRQIYRYILPGILALMLLLAGGYAAIRWQVKLNGMAIKGEMVRQAVGLASAVHPSLVRQLRFEESDLDNPAYLRIREQMKSYADLLPDLNIYSMKLVDSMLVFGPESLPAGHPLSSRPGTTYPVTASVLEAYRDGLPVALGPFTDAYGEYVSALAPVFDTRTNHVLMMVGMDMPASRFEDLSRTHILLPVLFTGLGVLIVLTWVLSLTIRYILRAGRRKKFRHLETVLVGITLMYCSLVAANYASLAERKFQFEVFDGRSASIHREFVTELFGVSRNLASVGRFIESSERVEKDEFIDFVQPILDYAPIHSIGMGREVDASALPGFEAMMRSDGYPDYRVGVRDGRGRVIPVSGRPLYYPVKHVLPETENLGYVGLDLMDDPVMGPLLARVVRDQAEKSIYLKRGQTADSSGLFIRLFFPIGRGTTDAAQHSPAERLRDRPGYVFADVYLPKVMQNALFRQVFEEPLFHIRVFDAYAPELQLTAGYSGPSVSEDIGFSWLSHAGGLRKAASSFPVFAFGKDLVMVIAPGPAFLKSVPATRFWLVFGIGLFLTTAFTLLIWFGVNHKAFLEQLVSERTRELDERIKELSCLQRVAKDLQALDSVELVCERILIHLRQAFEDPSRVFPSIELDGILHALAEEPENPDHLIRSGLTVSGRERGRLCIALVGTPAFLKEEYVLADQVSHALSLWLERKESVAGLQNALAWQEAIFEGSRDAIFISDANSRFVSVNTSACLLTGYSREELLAMRIQDLHEEVDLDAYHTYHQKILGGEQIISEARIQRKDGKKVVTSFNNQRIIVEGNTYMHSSARDITAGKQAEMELVRAKERAEESDRLKTAFLNNLSHEVRTPLNAIVGFSDVLDLDTEGESPGRIQHLTGIIRNSSQQLLSIIDDIINISTLEAGLQKAYETRTDIRELIQAVYDQYTMAASNKDLRFSIDRLPAERDSHVLTDKTKVQQVLGNLVGNALKFTEKGRVAIDCVMKDGFLRFSVTDTGIGIDPVHRDKVFERFRQVETEHARVKGGLGLGLSISRAFVELLGGKIWYESEKGSGSSFFFTIPFQPLAAPEPLKAEPDSFRFAGSGTILVAEDEEHNFELIKEFLSGSGLRILHARDGKEAVEVFKKEKDIALVIMDIKMPVMGGFEATAAIKAVRPGVPVIAVTAYAQSGDRKKALEAGCDDYLSKPLTRKGFLSKLRSFLERN